MSYFAAAFAREDGDWNGAELDLEAVETLEELADEAKEQFDADTEFVLVLIEDEDWFALVRVPADGGAELYVSDAAEAVKTPIGEVLVLDAGSFGADDEPAETGETAGDEDGFAVPSAPIGEPGLLTDLGVKSDFLSTLVTRGTPPADVLVEVVERIGMGEAYEDLRESLGDLT